MIYSPTIISQCLSSQAVYINKLYGQMFYFTDQKQLWYDTQDGGRVQAYDIVILQYERNRNNFVPDNIKDFPTEPGYGINATNPDLVDYSMVYVVETNCLYRYKNNIWTTIYGRYGSTNVAQTYLPNGNIRYVVADDVTTNGILNDGSVVIRDANKMICGLLLSDGYVFNINSLIGGCINLNPSGIDSGPGTLQLNANYVNNTYKNSSANLNGDLVVFGDIRIAPAKDWNKQYRLVKANLNITQNSIIKAGSLIKSESKINNVNYTTDTTLTNDIQTSNSYITQNSKLYIGSIINNTPLQPPFLFDIDKLQDNPVSNIQNITDIKLVTISGTTLNIDIDFDFMNTGDSIYIPTYELSNLNSLKKISLKNDKTYNIDYISKEGINNTAKIVFYIVNNTVKILP